MLLNEEKLKSIVHENEAYKTFTALECLFAYLAPISLYQYISNWPISTNKIGPDDKSIRPN